jgi:hypothetical protein
LGSVLGASLGVSYAFSQQQIASFEKQLETGETELFVTEQGDELEDGDLSENEAALLERSNQNAAGMTGLQAQLEMQLMVIAEAKKDSSASSSAPSSGKE